MRVIRPALCRTRSLAYTRRFVQCVHLSDASLYNCQSAKHSAKSAKSADSQPANQPVGQSADSQPANQPIGPSVNYPSGGQSVNSPPVSPSVNKSTVRRSGGQPVNRPTGQPVNRSISQSRRTDWGVREKEDHMQGEARRGRSTIIPARHSLHVSVCSKYMAAREGYGKHGAMPAYLECFYALRPSAYPSVE